ncbi:hypothetical protein DAPPUDRAFT_311759 [Daphnia pulex]|uniref:Uncharacterized protein n=1 Tax=Daphnia pulex TaxID=6669 RepID=E9FXU4_DAPPU|nr:hypothetical protein DAPPUDRAFT_311759 [Daphnia pulex]|eukprot:EFX88162.1 hypothetical protein DAPPUDRAFT_311759 [Daphnia pulex]
MFWTPESGGVTIKEKSSCTPINSHLPEDRQKTYVNQTTCAQYESFVTGETTQMLLVAQVLITSCGQWSALTFGDMLLTVRLCCCISPSSACYFHAGL